jgi:cyclophilin family peptidyl-prolyl cis-trans isomerase
MQTSHGEMVLELNDEKAPISAANFMSYVAKGHYDGTIFHRVISGFMIQGGGFTAEMVQKPTDKPIRNEWQNGLKNTRGTLSMARLGGNADSATCQFFINVVDNGFLDRPQPDGAAYAVFGRVVSGMEAVDKIRAVNTGMKKGMGDVPTETVTIVKVRAATETEAAKFKS